jgi:hypothetical protein
MKKRRNILAGTLVMLLAGGGIFLFLAQARAEDNANSLDQSPVPTLYSTDTSSNEHTYSDEEEKLKQEDNEIDEVENEEDGVKEHINQLSFDVSSDLPEVNSDNLSTYGDVVAILGSYSSTLDTLISQSSATSSLESSLSQTELSLLSTVLIKYRLPFVRLSARAQEIKDQIKSISDLLAPLSSSDISPLLKKSIVSALKDFREEIKGFSELEHLNYDIIDTEISN